MKIKVYDNSIYREVEIIKQLQTLNNNRGHDIVWGLGDDGKLYSTRNTQAYWSCVNGRPYIKISFEEILAIAKQFGHLVIFT